MAFSSGGSGGPMAEINVTPLVDVMLVLLIIFMITAPLMAHKVKVELPEATLDAGRKGQQQADHPRGHRRRRADLLERRPIDPPAAREQARGRGAEEAAAASSTSAPTRPPSTSWSTMW
jgi:hypothetical protein